jgi:hypothetical protein
MHHLRPALADVVSWLRARARPCAVRHLAALTPLSRSRSAARPRGPSDAVVRRCVSALPSSAQVVAIKGAKVGSWNSKSLTLWQDSQVTTHPDMQEAHSLLGWWQSVGQSTQLHSISSAGGGGGKGGRRIFFSDIDELALGMNSEPVRSQAALPPSRHDAVPS